MAEITLTVDDDGWQEDWAYQVTGMIGPNPITFSGRARSFGEAMAQVHRALLSIATMPGAQTGWQCPECRDTGIQYGYLGGRGYGYWPCGCKAKEDV